MGASIQQSQPCYVVRVPKHVPEPDKPAVVVRNKIEAGESKMYDEPFDALDFGVVRR